MKNLSLARIMYGTNDDSHSSANTVASVLARTSTPSLTEISDKTVAEQETLSELLHRAWVNLSNKH
ncbi:MAG: hypothetical protein WBR26_02925 [Candidatus Acidiferrum sp.]